MKLRIVTCVFLFFFGIVQAAEVSGESNGLVNISAPDVWNYGDPAIEVSWDDFEGTFFKVELWKRDSLITVLSGSSWIEGETSFTIDEVLTSEWGTGIDFRIHLINDLGESNWSERFQIFSTVNMLEPNASSYWSFNMDSVLVEWEGCQGDSIRCFLYKGDELLCNLGSWSENSGYIFLQNSTIPRVTGENFSVLIEDDWGNSGISEKFDIGSIYAELSNNDPLCVEWEGGGAVIFIELFSEENSYGRISPPVDNTGLYQINIEDLPTNLAKGPWRLKINDNLGEFGWVNWNPPINYASQGPLSGMEFVFLPEKNSEVLEEESAEFNLMTTSTAIMTTEVTQEMWIALMDDNPSYNQQSLKNPVESITYQEILEFTSQLNAIDSFYNYRLPTSEEWEYAGLACFEEEIDASGWSSTNSAGKSHPVQLKEANALGMFDMVGNVSEMCLIQPFSEYSSSGEIQLALRGGNWSTSAEDCTIHHFTSGVQSESGYITVGFRLLREVR